MCPQRDDVGSSLYMQQGSNYYVRMFDVRLKPTVPESEIFVCHSVASYALDNTSSNARTVGENYEDRHLLLIAMGWFRGISIGIVSNDRVRAAITIISCATDMIVEVIIGSYFGHRYRWKIIPSMLSFEVYYFIARDKDILLNG